LEAWQWESFSASRTAREVNRGTLLRTGIAGTALLAIAGCAHSRIGANAFEDDAWSYRVLGVPERSLIAALAGAFLNAALPRDGAQPQRDALLAAVRGFDTAVAGLPPADVAKIKQLLGLLDNPFLKPLATGIWSSWSEATTADVASFLTRWRYSPIELFRGGYDVLHQLTMAAWYGQNRAWGAIGYAGPPKL